MKLIVLVFSLIVALPHTFAAILAPADVAIAQASRPADDKKADERRHPRELLEFSQVKAGDVVVDILPGHGYFTRLFSSVVGPKGHVIAFVPKEIENAKFKPVDSTNAAVLGLGNAEVKVAPLLSAPAENVDLFWISQNYHDLHIPKFIATDVAAFNKMVFKMLKPGGHYVVVDHVAASGATNADIEKLHRIDPKQARKEIEAAGFVFEAETKVLARDENHSLNVFDPAIRGLTDQFADRFVKPKK